MRSDTFATCVDHLLQVVVLEIDLHKRHSSSPMPTAVLLAAHADALLALATDEQLPAADVPQLFELFVHIFRSLRDPVKSLVVILVEKLSALLPEVEFGDAARPLSTPEQGLFRCTQSIWRLLVALAEQDSATCECVIDRTLDFVFSDAAVARLRPMPVQPRASNSTSTSLLQVNYDRTIGATPKFRPNARFSLRPRPLAPTLADFERNHSVITQVLSESARASFNGAALLVQHLVTRLSSLHTQPTMQQYDEALPRRTTFERDQWLLQLTLTNPLVMPLLETAANVANPSEALPLHAIIRSMLANIIGDWNSEAAAAQAHLSPHLSATERLLAILRKIEMVPPPLGNIGDVLYAMSPREVVMSLMGLWGFLREQVAAADSFVDGRRRWPEKMQLGPHLRAVQVAARNNIKELAPLYGRLIG